MSFHKCYLPVKVIFYNDHFYSVMVTAHYLGLFSKRELIISVWWEGADTYKEVFNERGGDSHLEQFDERGGDRWLDLLGERGGNSWL